MKKVHKRTKIVATLGPASSPKEILSSLIEKGVDVCRLNFSHGSQEDHLKVINTIKEINAENNLNIGILADLQGPKIRIGKMKEGGAILLNGKQLRITTKEMIGNEEEIYITYQEFPKDVTEGEIILLDDGKIQLRVLKTNSVDSVTCEVVHGGVLTSRKGVNLPNTKVSIPSLTEEDLDNLHFVLNYDVEWIGMSFVRTAEDILQCKKIIAERGKTARVIAKIEKPEAIENIDSIIAATDGVMVARGDLGVEIPMEQVPLLQKMIVQKCRDASKPVIIATQMLESMITTPRPTRAEVNDVANSVLDGADAVMLSGETSVGEFPEIVIETMTKIIKNVEGTAYPYFSPRKPGHNPSTSIPDSICASSVYLAQQVKAKAIVAMTSSGYTAFEISSHRPDSDIHIFTGNKSLLNTLSLLWGVKGFYYDGEESTDSSIADVNSQLKEAGLISSGDLVVNTASIPISEKGRTNMIKVTEIK
ncbi:MULTISPECIES: pyruvate kinase [Olivibacter]|jgi:pyruvate kinase|uniref:Pyruvate kinase n=3 Tax=Sphingobacteriaceae TaxID=84566 RepID=F4CFA1_SPHS2|nr:MULTISPECIES: pyruvate kinase [Olivibacter]MCL4642176.1 pyruvate kinase [Olivibacter sp. UJ_SKK_5.1]MDM8177495.1 pyruvate kinase [Olivibacter sp. 47]MDX3912214.1 pyruvate kinase [Pseudosphingobacterium sp.]QEK99946.1 pyruvate kinase [Olivibacter sp. LS-1]